MKNIYTLIISLFCTSFVFGQSFTNNNILVFRSGDGAAALSNASTPIFLDEYTPAGVLVQSVALPIANVVGGNQAITTSGAASADGLIKRSPNGSFVVIAGYNAVPGVATIAGTTAASNNRIIATITNNKTINSTTLLGSSAFSGGNIRSAITLDGSKFWSTGSNTGVVFATLGGGTVTTISTTATNNRAVNIYDGNIYSSNGSGSGTARLRMITGLPENTGNANNEISGFATSGTYADFIAFNRDPGVTGIDLVYVLNGNSVEKFSFDGAVWTSRGTVVVGTNLSGITGRIDGANVIIFTTRSTELGTFTDNAAYNATITGTYLQLATAPTNTAFRGVSLTPNDVALPITLTEFAARQLNKNIQLRWSTGTESNTDRFEILRSGNNNQFELVGTVAAAGFSSKPLDYTWVDEFPLSGINYYKLRQVDIDGKASEFEPIAVNAENRPSELVSIVQNDNSIQIGYYANQSGATVIDIFDLSGRKVRSQEVLVQQGFNTIQFVSSDLSTGMQFVRVRQGAEQFVKKFVK